MFKKLVFFSISILILLSTVVFAENNFENEQPYTMVENMSKIILNILSWVGYVAAFGMLIWIGIKYMTSAANERANLKNVFLTYIGGVILIVLCSTIASSVANIASSVGDNSAEGLVDKGLGFKDLVVSGEHVKEEVDVLGDYRVFKSDNGNVIVHAPEVVDVKIANQGADFKDMVIKFPKEVAGKKLLYVHVKIKDSKDWIMEAINVYPSDMSVEGIYYVFKAKGSDTWFFNTEFLDESTKYEVWAVYESKELDFEELTVAQTSINSLSVMSQDGALIQIKYNDKIATPEVAYDADDALRQHVDNKVEKGTVIDLQAPLTSHNNMIFDYWAIVDYNFNPIEIISRNARCTYTMPGENVAIMAFYKNMEETPTIPEENNNNNNNSNKVMVSNSNNGTSIDIETTPGTKLAVLTTGYNGQSAMPEISIRNTNKKPVGVTESKQVVGNTYSQSSNEYIVQGYEIGANESNEWETPIQNGKYFIDVSTNTGMEENPENIKVYRYDKNGNKEEVTNYEYRYDNEYGGSMLIELDFDNYAYVVLVTENGLEQN